MIASPIQVDDHSRISYVEERVDEPGDKLWVPGRCDECAGCLEVTASGG